MTTPRIVSESRLIEERKQGLALISPIKQSILSLDVKTPVDYEHADGLLARIRQAKSNWLSRINPIIEPIRSGLDLLYDLRKDIIDPLEELEDKVKASMKAFKVEEARQLRQAEEKRLKELQELQRQAREKEEREAKARTNAMRVKLAEARAELEQKIATAKAQDAPAPIKAAASQARTKVKWKVTDMTALIKYLTEEEQAELISIIMIDSVQMNAYFKLMKPKVGQWMPGVEVFEDIDIAGRG